MKNILLLDNNGMKRKSTYMESYWNGTSYKNDLGLFLIYQKEESRKISITRYLKTRGNKN